MHSAKNIKLLVIQPVAIHDYLLPFLCRIKYDLLRKPMNFISLKGTSNLEVTVKNMSIAKPLLLAGDYLLQNHHKWQNYNAQGQDIMRKMG